MGLKHLNSKELKQSKRVIALAILFFAGGGLDISSILGISMTRSIVYFLILVCFLNKYIDIRLKELLAAIASYAILLFLYKCKGGEMPYWLFFPIMSGYFVATIYRSHPEHFLSDISKLCRYYAYYSLVAALIMLLARNFISPSSFYRYSHSFYLFWYINGGGPDFVNGLRVTGLGGEPGIWQMFLCFNLLFALYERREKKEIIVAILAIVTTFSTTGYFILLFVVLYYYTFIERRIKRSHLLLLGILSLFLYGLFYENITNKLSNSSGLTRVSDIFIGLMYLKRSPFLGVDPYISNFSVDAKLLKIKYAVWDAGDGGDFVDMGYLESGLCSGIMCFILDYGILFASYYFYHMFKFPLIRDKYLRLGFLFILLLTLMTEPQSRTGYFYFIILASFINYHHIKA